MRNKMVQNQRVLEKRRDLVRQKRSIEENYEYLKCRVNMTKFELTCKGQICSDFTGKLFQIELRYSPFQIPRVFVRKPNIPPSIKIHMYSEGNLCLYHPDEINWNKKSMIYDLTIPRIAEWIMYYELWQLTGEWEGPEYPHPINEKKK